MREIIKVSVREENRDWGAEKLKSCSPFFILSLLFPFSSFSWNHSLYLPFSLCSLCLWSFTEFTLISKTTFIWGTWSVVQVSTITNHKPDSIQKILWCCAILSELVSAFVYSRPDEKTKCHNMKRKRYSSWWQALDFFLQELSFSWDLLPRLHGNARGVHTRLWWTFDCLKQGKGNLNFESCFSSIHLSFLPEQSISFVFGDFAKVSDLEAFLYCIKTKLLEHKLFLLTILIANHQLAYNIDWYLYHHRLILEISIAKSFIEWFCLQQRLKA